MFHSLLSNGGGLVRRGALLVYDAGVGVLVEKVVL